MLGQVLKLSVAYTQRSALITVDFAVKTQFVSALRRAPFIIVRYKRDLLLSHVSLAISLRVVHISANFRSLGCRSGCG